MTNDQTKGSSPRGSSGAAPSPAQDIKGPSPRDDRLGGVASPEPHDRQSRLSEESRPSGRRRRQLPSQPMGRLKKLLFFAVILVGLYAAAGFFLAPYLLTSTLPKLLAEKINRPVTIASARVNPFTLNITLKNGIIGPDLSNPDDQIDPIVSFGKLEGRLNPGAFAGEASPLKSLRGTSLFIHLCRQQDGRFNIVTMLQRLNPAESAWRPGQLATLLQAGGIHLTDSRLFYTDLASGSEHRVEDIRLSLPQGRPDATSVAPQFSAIIDGSPISMGGEASGQGTRLTLSLEAIHLTDYLAYLPAPLPGLLSKGEADMELVVEYQMRPDQQTRFEIRGNGVGRDLWLQSRDKSENTIAGATFSFRFYPAEGHLRVDKLILEQPNLQIQRSKEGAYFLPGGSPTSSDAGPSAVNIDTLIIKNGQLSYIDQKVAGGFGTIFNDINFSMERLDGKDGLYSFALNSVTSRKTRIASQGKIALTPVKAQGLLVLHNLPITALNSYLPGDQAISVSGGIIDKAETTIELTFPAKGVALSLTDIQASASNLDLYYQGKEWLHVDQGLFREARLATAPLTFSLGNMTLRGLTGRLSPASGTGLVNLLNQPREGHALFNGLQIDNGALRLHGFSFLGDQPVPLQIKELKAAELAGAGSAHGSLVATLQLPDKGLCHLKGDLDLAPLTGSLQVDLQQLELASFTNNGRLSWLAPEIRAGALNLSGTLSLADLALTGQASLQNLLLQDPVSQQPLLRLKKGETKALNLSLSPFTMDIDALTIAGAQLSINRSAATGSLATHFLAADAPERWRAGTVAVNTITLTDGSLHYTDTRLKPAFSTDLTGLQGSLATLTTSGDQPLHINLSATTGQQARLATRGTVHLFTEPFAADLKVKLARQPLDPFIPYLETMVGYSLIDGIFDFSMAYQESGDRLNASSQLALRHLTLGTSEMGNKHFPFIIALVTDQDGIIHLDIDISGDMTDPSYTFHSAYGKKLRALISKASVSPFSMLSGFYEGDEPPDHVLFAPGTTQLKSDADSVLRAISDILANRPLLAVTLKGYSAGSDDRDALLQKKRDEAERKRLAQQRNLSSELVETYGHEEIVRPPASMPKETAGMLTVAKQELLNLAYERCLQVKELLSKEYGVDDSRITISADTTVVPQSGAGLAGTRADFILKRYHPAAK